MPHTHDYTSAEQPQDMPPGGPAPGPAEGSASPDEVMEAEQAASDQQRAAVSAAAPEPKKPYSVKKISSLFDEFKGTVKKLAGDEVPVDDISWEPPEGAGPKWDQPLPDPVFPAMVLISQVVQGAGPEFEKYYFDPSLLVDDSALTGAQAKIRMMGKDKKLKEVLGGGEKPEAKAEEEEPIEDQPAPEDMGADDEEIMSV